MIGVTGAKGLIAIVDARIGGERPRPEIQQRLESAKADSVWFVRLNMARPSHPPWKGGNLR